MTTLGIALGLLAYVLLLLSRSLFRVEEGHRALLTSFGAVLREDGQRPRTYGPGLHRKAPWHRVHIASIREENLDLSTLEGGRTAMAEDGTVLRFDSVLRFAPVEAELERYLFGMRTPREHIAGLFSSLLRNEIANIRVTGNPPPVAELGAGAGSYAMVRRERHQLNGRLAEFFRSRLPSRYGIEFRAIDLTDMLPPDELMDALNAVMSAHSEADAHHARAEADCSQRLMAAERGVEIARISASAVESEAHRLFAYLLELHKSDTLDMYVNRRRAEVLSESRAVFVRRNP